MNVRRALGVVLPVAALAVLVLARPALAHAGFRSSDPADGARLERSPTTITLTFTEAVDPSISTVRLLDAAGRAVATGSPEQPTAEVLRLPLPEPLARGSYTVTWLVVSAVDGHVTSGAIAFGVGVEPGEAAATATPPVPSTASPLGIGARTLLLVGVALLLGLGVVGAQVLETTPASLRPLAVAAGLATFGGAALLVAAEVALLDRPAAAVLASEPGERLLRLLIGAGLAAAVAVVAAARPRRATLTAAGAAGAVVAVLRAGAGHAAPAPVDQALQAAHILAVGGWIGGLAVLLVALRAGVPDPVRTTRRFSATALVAAAVVVLTGTLRAWSETGGPAALAETATTAYGRLLGLKVVAALALIALGARNRRRSLPALAAGDPAPLRRVGTAELLVALGVFALTGALTSVPPRPTDAVPVRPPAIRAEGLDFATTVRASLSVTPGLPGSNVFALELIDPDRGDPVNADEVSLTLEPVAGGVPAQRVELRPSGTAWRAESSALAIAGTWRATVRVVRGSQAVEVPLVVTTRVDGARSSVVEAPGQLAITTIAYRDGTSAQLYLDPGDPGPNQLHATVFDAAGEELQILHPTLVVVAPDGSAARADLLRFGPGHVVAELDLEPGMWVFDLTGSTPGGGSVQATLRARVEPAP